MTTKKSEVAKLLRKASYDTGLSFGVLRTALKEFKAPPPVYFEANIATKVISGNRFFVTLEVRRKWVDLLVVATCERVRIPKDEFDRLPKAPAKVVKSRLVPQIRRNAEIFEQRCRRDRGKAVKRAISIINAVRREGVNP